MDDYCSYIDLEYRKKHSTYIRNRSNFDRNIDSILSETEQPYLIGMSLKSILYSMNSSEYFNRLNEPPYKDVRYIVWEVQFLAESKEMLAKSESDILYNLLSRIAILVYQDTLDNLFLYTKEYKKLAESKDREKFSKLIKYNKNFSRRVHETVANHIITTPVTISLPTKRCKQMFIHFMKDYSRFLLRQHRITAQELATVYNICCYFSKYKSYFSINTALSNIFSSTPRHILERLHHSGKHLCRWFLKLRKDARFETTNRQVYDSLKQMGFLNTKQRKRIYSIMCSGVGRTEFQVRLANLAIFNPKNFLLEQQQREEKLVSNQHTLFHQNSNKMFISVINTGRN